MSQVSFCYLFEIQYLGYGYHGWQKQPNVRTVQGMVERAIAYVLGHDEFRVLGASRTDAKVSALQSNFELFLRHKLENIEEFTNSLRQYLPADIRVFSGKEVNRKFNVVQHPSIKVYDYNFAFGEMNHPFSTVFLTSFEASLDIQKMMVAAKVFVGNHSFHNYCFHPSQEAVFEREILESQIVELEGNEMIPYCPEEGYVFRVKGYGFMRHQVRLMMGTLVNVGLGKVSIEAVKTSLMVNCEGVETYRVPASGLVLRSFSFIDLQKHFIEEGNE